MVIGTEPDNLLIDISQGLNINDIKPAHIVYEPNGRHSATTTDWTGRRHVIVDGRHVFLLPTLKQPTSLNNQAQPQQPEQLMSKLKKMFSKQPQTGQVLFGDSVNLDRLNPFPPAFLTMAMQTVLGAPVEGVFRLAASSNAISTAINALNVNPNANISKDDIHLHATLIKRFYRSAGIFPSCLPSEPDKLAAILQCVLSERQRALLRLLIDFCQQLVAFAAETKMDAANLATCIGPNLVQESQGGGAVLLTLINEEPFSLDEYLQLAHPYVAVASNGQWYRYGEQISSIDNLSGWNLVPHESLLRPFLGNEKTVSELMDLMDPFASNSTLSSRSAISYSTEDKGLHHEADKEADQEVDQETDQEADHEADQEACQKAYHEADREAFDATCCFDEHHDENVFNEKDPIETHQCELVKKDCRSALDHGEHYESMHEADSDSARCSIDDAYSLLAEEAEQAAIKAAKAGHDDNSGSREEESLSCSKGSTSLDNSE